MLKDKTILLILGSILALFFIFGLLPNHPILLILKIAALLALILALGYYFYHSQLTQSNTTENHSPENTGQTELEKIFQLESDHDVEEMFNHFVDQLLQVIKKTVVAQTVLFLLVHRERNKFFIRHVVSDVDQQLTPAHTIGLKEGLPALVIKHRTPIIENHLPTGGKSLLPYYREKKNIAQSFVGVPVYFNQKPIGALCADAADPGAFTTSDAELLEHFAHLLTLQIVQSNQLYEYETENWIGKVLNDFSSQILTFTSEEDFWPFVCQFLKNRFQAERTLIIASNSNDSGEVIQGWGDIRGFRKGYTFPLNEGILGWVLRKKQSLLVDDFAQKDQYIPRLRRDEEAAREFRSLLAVPFNMGKQKTMAIVLESYRPDKFKNSTRQILQTIANQVRIFLEKNQIFHTLQQNNIFDASTKLGNFLAFKLALKAEIQRSQAFRRAFTIYYIHLNYPPTAEEEMFESLLKEFLSFALPIRERIHYIFRLSENLLAILFPEASVEEAQRSMESICERVQQHPVWLDGKVQDVSISCGGVQFPEMGQEPLELMVKAEKAMRYAQALGENRIVVYSEKLEGNDL